MGFSLGWHIVLASLGVAFPAMIVAAEWRGLRRGDPVALLLARRWARTFAALFAVGAVSGTIISFEMGRRPRSAGCLPSERARTWPRSTSRPTRGGLTGRILPPPSGSAAWSTAW